MSLPTIPIFVLPYKRYASFSLLPVVQKYLDDDCQSYESCARNEGMVQGYVTPEGQGAIDERALHRSTAWRLATYLGSLVISLQRGLDLWQQYDSSSSLHRFMGAIAPHKYRTPQRAETLRTARRLLHLIDRWDRTFPEKFFPRFATRSGVP